MAEYIEREALWSDIMMLPHNGDIISSAEVEQAIKDAPAADVVEVKHGPWIPVKRKNIWGDEVNVYECSTCKKSDVGGKGITRRSDFCPNCGAKMDGAE